MKGIKILSLILFLSCCTGLFAQNITVSGNVSDENTLEPLAGVSITVKGTKSGTITDLEGNFTLSASPDATLNFEYISYTTKEVKVGNQSNISVLLAEDAEALEEVVIVGTSMKKSDLTGAVASVSGKTLEERPVNNINQALQGRAAGVFISSAAKPGDDSKIKIRGTNTINASSDPIYVVDGLVMDNSNGGFNSINMNDVANIQILKDASATALYGSRAANGVVVITTKKGEKGTGKVSYDGWYGVQTYAKTPETMGSQDLFRLRRDAAINSYSALHPNATQGDMASFINNRVMDPHTGAPSDGYVFAQYELDAYANGTPDSDWLGEVTRNGGQQNHIVNFSGADDKSSYYISFGYSGQEGMVKNLSDTKYTGRINADRLIKPWLKVGTNTSFTRTESEILSDDGVYDKARGANPMLPVDPNLMTLDYGNNYDQNYFNPIRTLSIENDRNRERLTSTNYVNINPIKGLNIRSSISTDVMNESRFKYVPNDIQEAVRYGHGGETTHDRDHTLTWQWDNTVTYDMQKDKHELNLLFGTSMTRNDRDYDNSSSQGYGTNDLSYYNIGAGYKTELRGVGSGFSTSTLESYVLRANYDYDNRYVLTGTARYDGSSKFAEGYQWGFFPSLSGAWNVTEEKFMENQEVFDHLKMRVGYGLVGNQSIDDYGYLTLYSPTVSNGQTTFVPKGQRGTEDLTWESQQQFNIGLDMAFLNNRLRLSADAFKINNKDLLMYRQLPITSGFNGAFENIGMIENKGLEFTIDADIIKTKDFQWNFSANISADRNKVTQLYGDNDAIYKIDGNVIQKEENLFIGESSHTYYMWQTGGIAQVADMPYLNQIDFSGRNVNPGDLYPVDVDGNKVIDEKDKAVVGSPDPTFYGGFSTDFSYKGFSLNAVFTYSYGAEKLSPYYESLITSNGMSIASVDLNDRWSPTNTDAQFPRPIYNDPTQSGYVSYSANQMDHSVQDASYLRLSDLTFSYTFPQKAISNLKLSNLRVYTTGSNLFCLTPYKGYDPEMGDWYPPTKMFVIGVNVSF